MSSSQAGLNGAIKELSCFPLFEDFDLQAIHSLCQNGKIIVHDHRDILFKFGEPALNFAVVLSGAYKLSRTAPGGDESIIYFSLPGDVLAALVMAQAGTSYPVTVQAMGPSRVLLLPKEQYAKAWLSTPHLVIRIQGLLSQRMHSFQSLKVMQRAPLYAKVASLLLQMIAQDKSIGEEILLPYPLTRKEISDVLGVTVESVIRIMSNWAKEGIITTNEQQIKVLQPTTLVRLVNDVPE